MPMSENEYQRIASRLEAGESLRKAAGSKAKCMAFSRLRDKREGKSPPKRGVAPLGTLSPALISNLKNVVASSEQVLIEAPAEITAESLFLEAKKALWRIMQQRTPMPAYLNLVIQICKEELPSWKSGKGNKQGTEEYKEILTDLLGASTPTFKLLKGRATDGQSVTAN